MCVVFLRPATFFVTVAMLLRVSTVLRVAVPSVDILVGFPASLPHASPHVPYLGLFSTIQHDKDGSAPVMLCILAFLAASPADQLCCRPFGES